VTRVIARERIARETDSHFIELDELTGPRAAHVFAARFKRPFSATARADAGGRSASA